MLFRALLLLIVLAPLPLGANREWAWTLCVLLTGVLGLAWALAALVRPARFDPRLPPVPVALFLGVCGWALVQTLPGVGSWAHPLWDLAGEALGEAVPGRISLAPDATWAATLRLAAYGLVFFLAWQYARDRARALEALRWLALAGVAYAVYGLAVFWSGAGMLLWFEDEAFRHDVRGTFVNRNSFATWLGLTLLCALALLYRGAVQPRNPAYRLPAGRGLQLEAFMQRAWLPLSGIILITTALMLTHSRAGFFSTLVGVGVLLLALNSRHPLGSRRSRLALVTALVALTAVFWITSEVLLQRIDKLSASYLARQEAYALTRDGIADNPWLGHGYGTYADSFRLYRDERLERHFDRAHNTYLENAFELGWPAAGALLLAIAWLALHCLRGLRRRGRDWVFPATGLAASLLVGVHSLFDFSLQMPATALAYAGLLGVACAQATASRESGQAT